MIQYLLKMKIKGKTLLAIGLIGALWAGFLIGISLDNSKPNQADLTGTFGKAQKYRKIQMTPKDIELRTGLMKDTAKLKSMIQGLICFAVFTEEVCNNIEIAVISIRAKGMGATPEESDQISALKSYADFIRNNNKSLNSTIAMLTGLYTNDPAKMAQDVEKNLLDFAIYVDNLNEKNSILNQAIAGIDKFLLNNKTLHDSKTAFAELKSIRDELLVKGIQLGAIISNKDQVKSLILYAMEAQEQYKSYATSPISYSEQAGARENIRFAASRENIESAIVGQSVSAVNSIPGLIGAAWVYDKPSLQFEWVTDQAQLKILAGGKAPLESTGIGTIAVIGKDYLNIRLDSYSLDDIVSAQVYYAIDLQYSHMLAQDNLRRTVATVAGINSILSLTANQALNHNPLPPD